MNKERRMYQFEIRAQPADEIKGRLTGRPIVYGSRTDLGAFYEEIAPGALDKTDLRDVAFLVNHNTDMIPLARSRNNNENSTMQMTIDNDGMLIRVDLDTANNADARALYSAIERSDLDGMSFMFAVARDEWIDPESEKPTRIIREISKVYEVSAVTFPAYAETSIAARNLSGALDSALESLDSAKRAAADRERQKAKIRLLTEVL